MKRKNKSIPGSYVFNEDYRVFELIDNNAAAAIIKHIAKAFFLLNTKYENQEEYTSLSMGKEEKSKLCESLKTTLQVGESSNKEELLRFYSDMVDKMVRTINDYISTCKARSENQKKRWNNKKGDKPIQQNTNV